MIAVLCGGVGAARMLSGLVQVVDPTTITAIVNTGDDTEMHGLVVCPDLDTITYTLAGTVNAETGWGLAGETWQAMASLERLGGHDKAWFRLGDRDLGTHLYRTARLSEGASLSQVTAEIATTLGVSVGLVPMSDDRVRTVLVRPGGEELSFQEYFVKWQHAVVVEAVRFEGGHEARPGPDVITALRQAEIVVIAPSNPIISIGPILAVPGIAEVLMARRDTVVAVSPIVGGAALKGPAARLLVELGGAASVDGVARHLAAVTGTLVIDEIDADLGALVEDAGVRPVVAQTVMSSSKAAASLARTVLASLG
ncbi:MAG: 2-phospho-L-lactate transferase [Acidimicrobiales bacterium]